MTSFARFTPCAAISLVLALLAGPAAAQTEGKSAPANPANTANTANAAQGASGGQGGSGPAKAGTTVTSSTGLVLQVLKPGVGPKPRASDVVRVHYRGTLADGSEFDSSYKRGEPAQFPLNRVIPCWTEGLQQTAVGATVRLTCPPAIAYGANGAGGVIPPNATLRFDVELLGIVNSR